MAKTFKDRLLAKQQAHFIGRSEQIDLFRSNLSDPDPLQIFNIYGQGGVGKSHLSKQCQAIAEERNCLTAYTDESVKSVLQWMEVVSAQYKERGKELTDFDKRYKDYLQETKKLESDPEKPKGTFGGLLKTITKGAIKEVKKLPVVGLVDSFIDEDGIASAIGEWADFVRKKVTNKDEVELLLEPEKVLTPLFWKGISKYANDHTFACFLIDTFEETDRFLENWLLDVLSDKHGDIPENILLVIAGREELNLDRWGPFKDLLQKIPLEPFTNEEARDYLQKNQIVDEAVMRDILNLSGNLPVLLAWLVSAAKGSKTSLTDACETAVERFLKWVDDKDQRDIALAAALPRQLNKDILETLLEDKPKADALFDWLTKQPFVSRRGDHWAYHSVVRDQMLRYVRTRSPKDWAKQHQMLRDYYDNLIIGLDLGPDVHFHHPNWMKYCMEGFYHALCVHPDKALPTVMNAFIHDLYSNGLNNGSLFVETLKNAGATNDHEITKGWGLRIQVALPEIAVDKADTFATIAHDLLQIEWIKEAKIIAYLFYVQGIAYSAKRENDQAIDCYQKSIEINPENYEAYNNMGNAYSAKGEKDQAINCYQKTIEIKPDYHEAFYNMGNAYAAKGENDKAIDCYQKAIDFIPDMHEAFNNMGNVFLAKRQSDKAIICYQKAIDIKPDFVITYIPLGFRLLVVGRIIESQPYFEKVIQLGEEALGNMNLGHVFLTAQNEHAALDCYQKSLTAFENKEVFWAGMKDDFQHLKQYGITQEYYDSVLEKVKKGNI